MPRPSEDRSPRPDRRRRALIAAIGTGGLLGLAGCSSEEPDERATPTATTSPTDTVDTNTPTMSPTDTPTPDPQIVVNATEFYDDLEPANPIGKIRTHSPFNTILMRDAAEASARRLAGNVALSLEEPLYSVLEVDVPAPGSYDLWVRAGGTADTGFTVTVDGETADTQFGRGPITWTNGGTIELPAGTTTIRLSDVAPAPILDAIVLTPVGGEPPTLTDPRGERWFGPDVEVLDEIPIGWRPIAVKFGDVTGDGRMDVLALRSDYSAVVYDTDGTELWRYDAPDAGSDIRGHEPPGLVYDLDGDGRAEVLHWRQFDDADRSDEQYLVAADGETGEPLARTEWPVVPPYQTYNYRLAVGKLTPGNVDDVLVFSDSGGTITTRTYTYDADDGFSEHWSHEMSLKKDHLGHYAYPRDLDGDGLDEVAVGSLLLDSDGDVIWDAVEPDHHDHPDSIAFADLTGDGHEELIKAYSDQGIRVYDATDGDIVWERPAWHAQKAVVSETADGNQFVAVNGRLYHQGGSPRLYAQLFTYGPAGERRNVWPDHPINGNPVFVHGDWHNDGGDQLFWHRFAVGDDGTGSLALGEPCYHMFDFTGDGAEEVLTIANDRVRVYGSPNAERDRDAARRAPTYMAYRVADHSHYTGW